MKFLAPLALAALSATGTNAFFRMPLNNGQFLPTTSHIILSAPTGH